MLKRKIEQSLAEWKHTANHKPLIMNPDYASVFSGSLEIDNIVMMLSALLGSEAVFEAGETVLILDEIQDCPEDRPPAPHYSEPKTKRQAFMESLSYIYPILFFPCAKNPILF